MAAVQALGLPITSSWFWWNDKNWTAFEKSANDRIEREYIALIHGSKKLTAAEKRIKLDDQRFLDFAFRNEAEIKSNFNNMGNEKNLVGLQRRYDDESKRRAVKRDVSPVLDGELVTIVGFTGPAAEALLGFLNAHGANTHPRVTQKVTFVVCDEAAYPTELTKGLQKAIDYDIPIISLKGLGTALTSGAKPSTWATYKYTPAPAAAAPSLMIVTPISVPVTAAPPAAAASSGSVVMADPKRKGEDDDGGKGKKAKGDTDLPWLISASKWQGVCVYALSGERYPFEMQMEPGATPRAVQGTITWTTLSGCQTKWRGNVAADNSFKFEEYECIKGDEVETPVTYEAHAAKASITGSPLLANLPAGEKATFSADLLSIMTTKGANIEGRVQWPTMKCETNFTGKLVPGVEISIEETMMHTGVLGDVPIPQYYSGKAVAGGGYAGECGSTAGSKEGTFKIKA